MRTYKSMRPMLILESQGYIIKVVSVLDVGQGKVMPGTGLAEFRSRYQAIVLKPVRIITRYFASYLSYICSV